MMYVLHREKVRNIKGTAGKRNGGRTVSKLPDSPGPGKV